MRVKNMITECIIMIISGLIMVIFGIITVSQDAFYLPWFTRAHVPDHLLNKYAKGMGLGSLFIGIGIALGGMIRLIFQSKVFWIVVAVGCSIGVLIIGITYFIYGRRR